MSSQTGNTKLLVPILLAAVLAGASVATVPFAAFAQTTTNPDDNSTLTAPADNSTATTDQSTNATATAPETNATATAAGNTTAIVGTIPVNGTQAADSFDPAALAIPETNATQIATAEVTNGTATNTQLDVVQGFLVYTVTVVDVANHNTYHVIVDPGDGNVLYTSPGIPAGSADIENAMAAGGGGSGSNSNGGSNNSNDGGSSSDDSSSDDSSSDY